MTPHALYRFYSEDDTLLYVGLTMNPAARWRDHSKDKAWWREVAVIKTEMFQSREEVAAAELDAIRKERPAYNIAGASTSELDDYTAQIAAAAERYAADRDRVRKSRDNLRDLVYLATRHGMSEVEAAKLAGVTRMTVRAWVGK